jgi:hypothetical protein
MKISELRKRENYDKTLTQTLQACADFDAAHTPDYQPESVQWYEHPILSVYVTPDFCADGRRYLNMQYRHAPRRSRHLVQAIATDFMTMPAFFSRSLKPAFQISSAGRPEYQMWMPGNHRFRRFDFEKRTIRVYPKAGFSADGIRQEIALRRQLSAEYPWVLPILWSEDEAAVFEEPLLEAMPFNRINSGTRQTQILDKIQTILRDLHQCQTITVTGEAYQAMKRLQLDTAYHKIRQKFPGLRFELIEQVWQRAAKVIQRSREIPMSLTHGDFQPGNLIVPADADNSGLWLIDWEDADVRASIYDVMTWTLQSRAPKGLASRVEAFLYDKTELPFELTCSRDLAVALWAVEEWIWLLESSAREGITQIPAGLCMHFQACSAYLCANPNL